MTVREIPQADTSTRITSLPPESAGSAEVPYIHFDQVSRGRYDGYERYLWNKVRVDDEEENLITFLPYPNFRDCARCLDDKRLGKQRVEAGTIIDILTHGIQGPLVSHPAVLMWAPHLEFLTEYYNEMIMEWIIRGFACTMPIFRNVRSKEDVEPWARYMFTFAYPPWLGMPELHASNRAALLAKNPEHYGQFGWTEEPVIDYFWPVTSRPKECKWNGTIYVGLLDTDTT